MEQPRPLNPAELAAQSDLLIERRRLSDARMLLARGLKDNPDDEALLHRAALVEYLDDDYDGALETVRLVLRKAPSHYGAKVLYAALLEETSELAQAEEIWLGLIREFPRDADCYASYAGLMLRTLNLDKARRLAAEALRLEPQNESALFALAMTDLIAGKRGAHSHHLEALIREHPEHVRTTLTLITALHDRHDRKGALRLAQELLRSRPTDDSVVDLVRELQVENHWSMLPLYPMRRWGLAGAGAAWGTAVFGLNVLRELVSAIVFAALLVAWLLYVVYSWVWPGLLKRLT